MITIPLQLFILSSCILGYFCRRQIINPRCHGFYRFFALQGIFYLALHNIDIFNVEFFDSQQIVTAILLISSLYCLIAALYQLRHSGGSSQRQDKPENFTFENTENLVTDGIYNYVRHPMYTSLLLFNWGIYWQQINAVNTLIAVAVSLFLFITAKVEEAENIDFFGSSYLQYKQNSKMIIPYVL